ncbi:hypothetical protein NBRC116493_02150 [Aurantivibrio infirmus]
MYFRFQKFISTIVLIMVVCSFSNISSAKSYEIGENNFRNGQIQLAQLSIKQKQKKTISKAEAAEIAQKRHGGKVLSVDTKKTESGVQYRVKLLLDNGRIRTVTIKG